MWITETCHPGLQYFDPMSLQICFCSEQHKPLHSKQVEGDWCWICAECEIDAILLGSEVEDHTVPEAIRDWCRQLVLPLESTAEL